MTPDREALIARLTKMATFVYLAAPPEVAADIASGLKEAIAALRADQPKSVNQLSTDVQGNVAAPPDIPALLARLESPEWRAVSREEVAQSIRSLLPPGSVSVPREVVEFLKGAGPLKGVWFGEKPPGETGNFWWRKWLSSAPDGRGKP